MSVWFGVLLVALTFGVPGRGAAQQTEIQYLSGHDKDDAVPWNFFCTSGAQSGYWTNLPVPSQWDIHGFGTLNYHKDLTNAWDEHGLYSHDFLVPESWNDRRIFLVFEGVMTDTAAKLNGQSVGPVHQGGFYRFKYEVTSLVKFGATNQLEVNVARHSANESVNRAERLADYWVFAGIYRPVYLEAVPREFIDRVAIDAQADGHFAMDVFLNGVTNEVKVQAQIQTLQGKAVGQAFSQLAEGNAELHLQSEVASPKLWTAETPNLYEVHVQLIRDGRTVHEMNQRFGFRTFEVRDGDGLYLNGQRVILKGCNRHSFWPDSGRTLSDAVQLLDIKTIKDMNMNAVRMSHYPPDADFLDRCDELGLYVLDELGGWHHFYDTPTGTKLVHEMVARDVNHPSILFWDNGNEGGFNTNLDDVFGSLDPQHRRVLHPWAPFDGLNTAHYLPYDYAKLACDGIAISFHKNHYVAETNAPGKLIYMPTEFMHGLYDGGAGAGLADTWALMEKSPYLGGGFIWAFLDEGVKRPDNGIIDVAGNQAPDGIVGPYRQREASFYAIKQIWSPIQILETNLPKNFDGTLTVANHFSFTDTKQCQFHWELRRSILPGRSDSNDETISAEGLAPAPEIPPGGCGKLNLNLPENFQHTADVTEGDFLVVRVDDPTGRELWTYTWPLRDRKVLPDGAQIIARADYSGQNTGAVELKGDGLVAQIDNGELISVELNGQKFSLCHGPRVAGNGVTLKKVSWQLFKDGWLQCNYTYADEGSNDYSGVTFDYPENLVKSKKWFGDGPYRVWKNRLAGVTFGLWQNEYNNTITGYRGWIYPEFKGCFADVRWLQLNTAEGRITVANDGAVPYLQVLTPEFPPANLAGHTIPSLPDCGLGFLEVIPPIGSKFQPAPQVSPSGQRSEGRKEYSRSVRFHFNAPQAAE